MSNTLTPPGTQNTVENSFNTYLDVVTKDSDSDAYDAEDLGKIKSAAKSMSAVVELIASDETLPSDREHKARQFSEAAPRLLNDLNGAIDKKYDDLIEPESEALFRYSLVMNNAQEIRAAFKDLAGDPEALKTILPQLDDVTLDALRSAPQQPVIEKKNGVVASVKLVKFISAELEESELRRRRPNTAFRLDTFENRKQTFKPLTAMLESLIGERLGGLYS